jgi:hemerythrin superfamily protein
MVVMENKNQGFSNTLDRADYNEFKLVVKRFKNEHMTMGIRVSGLLTRADQVQLCEDLFSGLSLLQVISEDVKRLMKDLADHEKWEEQYVFPLTSKYYKYQLRPSIIPSIAVLEKEHDLVKKCFQPFLNLSEEILVHTPISDLKIYGKLRLCIVYLYQGASLLQEHFELEEGLIYPLVDEILAAAE